MYVQGGFCHCILLCNYFGLDTCRQLAQLTTKKIVSPANKVAVNTSLHFPPTCFRAFQMLPQVNLNDICGICNVVKKQKNCSQKCMLKDSSFGTSHALNASKNFIYLKYTVIAESKLGTQMYFHKTFITKHGVFSVIQCTPKK